MLETFENMEHLNSQILHNSTSICKTITSIIQTISQSVIAIAYIVSKTIVKHTCVPYCLPLVWRLMMVTVILPATEADATFGDYIMITGEHSGNTWNSFVFAVVVLFFSIATAMQSTPSL